jgi:putative phosphoesterase
VRLLLIADTHVPMRARDLPRRVWDEVADADVVLHAGDWVEPELLDQLEARAARLVACWGKNDGAELRRRLPERADATLGGLRFTVVHETGAATGRDVRMANEYPDTDVLVFGHSHGTVTLFEIYSGAVDCGAMAMDQCWGVGVSGGSVERSSLTPDREALIYFGSPLGRAEPMPSWSKVRGDAAKGRQEPLGMPH